MNVSLYKKGIKESYKLWLIILAVMSMYISIVISMYNPDIGNIMDELVKAMPCIMELFGMKDSGTTLLSFMANYLYGMIFLIFPMIFTIMVTNGLIAKQVEGGSMVYLLTAPSSRKQVAVTQLLVLLTGVISLILVASLIGWLAAQVMFPGHLELELYWKLNASLLCLHLFIAGICFLSSAFFNETKWSLSLGAGIPILSYVIQMIANLGGKYENAKYASFFTFFSPQNIIGQQDGVVLAASILLIGSLILYGLAISTFTKKDLPL